MHKTARFDALGFRFQVLGDDARLIAHVDDLFADLATSGEDGGHRFVVQATPPAPETPPFQMTCDGRHLVSSTTREGLVPRLVAHVNIQAVDGCSELVLHAGGVEHVGTGIVLPGSAGAGKTTLTAGLVRAGFGYLTDEAVVVDRADNRIRPYPKPLSIDPGAWNLFPEFEPRAGFPRDDYKTDQWQVPSGAIRDRAVGVACPIGLVVFPRYAAGAATELAPIGRAEAIVELTHHTIEFREHAREALDLLAEIVRGADCYRLTMGDLHPAVDAIVGLVGLPRSAEPAA